MRPMHRDHEQRVRAFLAGEPVEWDGRDDTEASLAAAMRAMVYWRERCLVEPEDVAREGVTPAKRDAYLRTVATEDRSKYNHHVAWVVGSDRVDLTVHHDSILDEYQDRVTARVIADVARGLQRSPWSVLHAMADVDDN